MGWRISAAVIGMALIAGGCTPATNVGDGTQRMSVSVTGRHVWSGASDIDGGRIDLSRSADGRAARIAGRTHVAGANGDDLEVSIDANRFLDALVGEVTVRNHTDGREVHSILTGETPVVERGDGTWSVLVRTATGSFYRGQWVPGIIEIRLVVTELAGDIGSVVIDDGSPSINRHDVTLHLRAPRGATEMRLADGDDPSGGDWQPVAATAPWRLPDGDGPKVVSVQFRGAAVGPPVSGTVLVDTTAPEIAFRSVSDGDTIDGADGRIVVVSGDASDGSGAGVETVTFDDGANGPRVAGVEGATWAFPVSPTRSGPTTYRVDATDLAGNAASRTIEVTELAPGGTGTLVRPGVLEVEGALASAVVAVRDDGTEVVFDGDQRTALAGRSVLATPSLPGLEETGLLHRIGTVEYQPANDRTVVGTQLGSMLDVFARLEPEPTVPAARTGPTTAATESVGSAACDEFVENRTVSASLDLPQLDVADPAGTARASLDLEGVVMADSSLRINGLSLTGSITGGLMLCGEATTRNDDAFATAGRLVEGIGIGLSATATAIPPILIGPIALRPEFSGELSPVMELAAASRENNEFNVGFVAGVTLGGGAPDFILETVVDSRSTSLLAGSGRSEWGAALTVGLGLEINYVVSTQLFSGGLQLTRASEPDWVGTPGAPGSYVTKIDVSICVTPVFEIGLQLDIGLPAFGEFDYSFTIVDVGKEFSLDPYCPPSLQSSIVAPGQAPTITTTALPVAFVESPYSLRLASNDPYAAWSIDGLPDGLRLIGDGRIDGAPTTAGTYPLTITATGLSRRSTTKQLTLVVDLASLSITSRALRPGVVGEAYDEQIVTDPAIGSTGAWSIVSGSLPPGLQLDTSTGRVTGTPTEDGTFTIGVRVTALDLVAEGNVEITVGLAAPRTTQVYHSCSVDQGAIECWGANRSGQLGNGTVEFALAPSGVVGITDASSVSLGDNHTCALTGDIVKCWGWNADGQRGDGTTTASKTPVVVPGLTGATAIAAGGAFTCAIVGGGAVQCWGKNFAGTLGDGSTRERSTTPVAVRFVDDAQAIAAGHQHACVIRAGGAVWCWGYGIYGQLTGSPRDANVPVAVPGVTATSIAVGRNHTCAVVAGGKVQCWGYNALGQLGRGTTSQNGAIGEVIGISGAVAVTAGGNHTCARFADGAASCWGFNSDGEVGSGSTQQIVSVPEPVIGLVGSAYLTAGFGHTCAFLAAGGARCWGDNGAGQLGNGTFVDSRVPVPVLG